MTVDVLGTTYTIKFESADSVKALNDADGFIDKTTKEIVICNERPTNELNDFKQYQKCCLRHEIIHAFLFESGLSNNFEHDRWGHDETTIDWFALQGLKIYKAWEEANAL